MAHTLKEEEARNNPIHA